VVDFQLARPGFEPACGRQARDLRVIKIFKENEEVDL